MGNTLSDAKCWLAAACGLLILSCSTRAHRRVLAAQPLPATVSPADPPWHIEVAIEPAEELRVRIINDGDEPVTVLWEECAYIDIDNRSHPVLPGLTRQRRATIAPGTRLEEKLVPLVQPVDEPRDPLLPATRRRFDWLRGGGKRPLLGSRIGRDHPLIGKQIGIFIVMERAGEEKTIHARYRIEEAYPH